MLTTNPLFEFPQTPGEKYPVNEALRQLASKKRPAFSNQVKTKRSALPEPDHE